MNMMRIRTPLLAALATTAALAAAAPTAGASTLPTSPLPIPTGFTGCGTSCIPQSASNVLASSQAMPTWAVPGAGNATAGGCSSATVGQGRTGGTANQVCTGTGLVFIGPSNSVSTVIGPTIITGAFVGTSIVSGGNVAIGP